jgi:hypothetical protein
MLRESANKNVREQERKQIGPSSAPPMHQILRLQSRNGNRQPDVIEHLRDSLCVPNLILGGTLVAPRAGSVTRHVTLDSETASAFGCDWRA